MEQGHTCKPNLSMSMEVNCTNYTNSLSTELFSGTNHLKLPQNITYNIYLPALTPTYIELKYSGICIE